MKALLIQIFLLLGWISANAEIIEIANYHDGLGTEMSIKMFMKENKPSSIIISCDTEDGNTGYIIQPINYLFALDNYLKEIKEKYVEWVSIAKSNEIDEYEKKFSASGYQYGFMWYSPDKRQGSSELNAIWKHTKDSDLVVVSAKVIDTLGSYETAVFHIMFSSLKDIEMMLDAISNSNIKSHTPTSIDSLFIR